MKKSKIFLLVFCGLWGLYGNVCAETQVEKLIREKRHKINVLEECSNKTKGFKIAGISTLGITAVGIGGNIALASKRKDLEQELNEARFKLKTEEGNLVRVKRMLKQSEQEAKKQELASAQKNTKKEEKIEKVVEKMVLGERFKGLTSLDECPGNLWGKIKQRCPECATESVRENVCFYNLDERYGINGFETGADKEGTWVYHIPEESRYYFTALLIDDCFCKEIMAIEAERKKSNSSQSNKKQATEKYDGWENEE